MNVDFRRDGATHDASFLFAIHVLCSIMGVWESMVWFGAVLDTASRAFTEEGQIPWEERSGLAERCRRRRRRRRRRKERERERERYLEGRQNKRGTTSRRLLCLERENEAVSTP